MDKKISTSEVLGELRRMSRQYKVFEKAVEAAETLLDYEKQVSFLQKEVNTLTELRAELEDECNENVLKIDEAKEEAKKINKKIKDNSFAANIKADQLKSDAEMEAKRIISDANNEIASIKASIDSIKAEETAAIKAKTKAVSDLDAVKKEIRETREKFAKSLA